MFNTWDVTQKNKPPVLEPPGPPQLEDGLVYILIYTLKCPSHAPGMHQAYVHVQNPACKLITFPSFATYRLKEWVTTTTFFAEFLPPLIVLFPRVFVRFAHGPKGLSPALHTPLESTTQSQERGHCYHMQLIYEKDKGHKWRERKGGVNLEDHSPPLVGL